MKFIGLDISKNRTGWALWETGWETARFGHKALGSEATPDPGHVYINLHKLLDELRSISRFEFLYYERPLAYHNLTGRTTIDTIELLSGLGAHARSYGIARNCRSVVAVEVKKWRNPFIGKEHHSAKRQAAKSYTMERCRQLGFKPRYEDEADAIGVLTYGILARGITPPWLADEVLRPMLTLEAQA